MYWIVFVLYLQIFGGYTGTATAPAGDTQYGDSVDTNEGGSGVPPGKLEGGSGVPPGRL